MFWKPNIGSRKEIAPGALLQAVMDTDPRAIWLLRLLIGTDLLDQFLFTVPIAPATSADQYLEAN